MERVGDRCWSLEIGALLVSSLIYVSHGRVLQTDGATPLTIASWYGHKGAVQALLDAGAKVNHAMVSTVVHYLSHGLRRLISVDGIGGAALRSPFHFGAEQRMDASAFGEWEGAHGGCAGSGGAWGHREPGRCTCELCLRLAC